MNVNQIDTDGPPRNWLFFVRTGYLVAGDVMLAQRIALETNEFGALAVANSFLPQKILSNLSMLPIDSYHLGRTRRSTDQHSRFIFCTGNYFQTAALLPGRFCRIAMFCLSVEIFDSARLIEAMRVLRHLL
jgi:hypothetical protein